MRRRLAVLVAATMTLVLVSFLVPLAVLVRTAAADRAIGQATVEAQSLSALVATSDREALRLNIEQLNASARFPVTVFLPDGTTLGAPVVRTPAAQLAARGSSFSVESPDGREIVVAVEGLPNGTAVIRSFVPSAELYRGVARAWLILALLGLLLLVLGVAVADRLAVAVVRPIGELAQVSRRLAAGDLEARAGHASGPPEVLGVADALNHLAGRIRELLQQEREAAADLSHRIRTPLTALRLEAESLRDRAESGRIAAHVSAVDRALSAAIEDTRRPAAGPADGAITDAALVVRARMAFWAVLAEDQDRSVRVDATDGPLAVALPSADLSACVDALVGNVFAHTPDGTAFAVRLMPRPDGGAVLIVEDDGSGFGPEVTARPPTVGVPAAGPLARGVSGGGSTGLGLDIARTAARRSGGSLTLGSSPSGGARVIVEFGG